MKKLNAVITALAMWPILIATAQTNPQAHILADGPFVFNGFDDNESTNYPEHIQGWRFSSEPGASEVGEALENRPMVGQSIPVGQGSIRNEGMDGISLRNSGSNHIGAVVLALNTSGREQITATYTVADMSSGSTRQNGVLLQYRIGEEGNFTTVEGTTYLSDPEGEAAAQNFADIALPEAVNNQPVVQLRWLYFLESGTGARDRIRIDDIAIDSEAAGAQGVEVTFRVDMSEFIGTINPAGMHIAGSFPQDTWDPAARQMTNVGDGIWSWTETLEPGFALEYKFVRGPGWQFGDENMGGQPCGAPGTTNRAITIPEENITLPAVCYGSCNPCNVQAPSSLITFQVDMSQEVIAPGGVGISGTFNSFEFLAMTDQGNGIYAITLELEQGLTLNYKFRNGDAFESPIGECTVGAFNDRTLTVPESDLVLNPVCYNSCEVCQEPGELFNLTLSVDASQVEVNPLGIYVAGSFSGFSPLPMTDEGNGIFTLTTPVESGTTATWKFLNGDNFENAEMVPETCGIPDGFDGFNRFIEMPEEDTTLETVCFGSCEACGIQPVTYLLVFQLDASEETISPDGMHIAGSFNGFTPQLMDAAGGGLFTFSVQVEGGSEVTWKYLNSADFSGQETVPTACGEADGFGGFNRIFNMPEANTVLPITCFSSCEECMPPPADTEVVFGVDADLIEVDPAGIHIAGNFNNWTPVPMNFEGGIYTFSITTSLTELTWKYLNGPSFDNAENVPSSCGVDDGFGAFNRSFQLLSSEEPVVLDVVCFSSCEGCPTNTSNAKPKGAFQLYPNPNDGNFVMVAPASGIADIQIFDLSGRLIHQSRQALSEGEIFQHHHLLEAGCFMVEIRFPDKVFATRMLVH